MSVALCPELEFSIMQQLSGNFLTSRLPDNWEDMEDDEQNEFIIDNAWEPLEQQSPRDVLCYIENAAECMIIFLYAVKLLGKVD